MGKERATTMMSLLPPAGWADVATKRDLDFVAERLETRIDRVAERLGARMDTPDVKFSGRVDARRHPAHGVTWTFASQAGVIAAMGVLLAILR